MCVAFTFSVNSIEGLLSNCLDSAVSCIFTEERFSCWRTLFFIKKEPSVFPDAALWEREMPHSREEAISLFYAPLPLSRPHADIICYDFTAQFKGDCGKKATSLSFTVTCTNTHTGVRANKAMNLIGINRRDKYGIVFFFTSFVIRDKEYIDARNPPL